MRLHRLTLRDVKGVRERTVELPDSGVVVLEGPNEVGKSTMLEAFDALLTYKSTSRAAEVRGLQPVDRDVPPFVEAELTIGGTRVRYAKQWLRQPATTLHVLGVRPEQLTGDAAQSRMDGLLRAHLDRTLYDALRLSQSGDGTVAPLVSSAVLTEALDAAAGAHQHADGADALLDRVEAEYRLYFTATGRPTGVYKEAMARHTQAQQDVAEAHRRLEEGAQLLRRQEAARERVSLTEAAAAEAGRRLAAAEAEGARVEAVAAAHEAARDRQAQALELRHAAVRAQEQRQRSVAEEQALVAALETARQAREADVERAQVLGEKLAEVEAQAAAATTAVEQLSDQVDAARSDADHLAGARELATAEAVLAQTHELVGRVHRARESQPARPVTRDEARGVRALQVRLDARVDAHVASSPTLVVEALGGSIEVTPADGGDTVEVTPGDSREVRLTQDTTVDLPGRGHIRVHLQQEAQGRVAAIDRLREELREDLARLGAADVDEADRLAHETSTARDALREAVREVESLLRPHGAALAAEAAGGVVPRALQERVDRLRERLAVGLASRTSDDDLPADEAEARACVEALTRQLRERRATQRTVADELARRRDEVRELTTRLDRLTGRIAADEARLTALWAQLASARQDLPDGALATQVAERTALVRSADEAVATAAAAVADADVAGVRARLQAAQQRHRQSVRDREAALAELHTVGGHVEMAAGEGRQELYDLAVADLDDAERELQAVDRRARAARHLRTTLTQHREAAHRTYVRPYTQALEDLGRRVYGPDFAVVVDEDLSLSARTLDGVTVPYADLSGGAKEQLGILARLAVARLVEPTQGVPVVIDDALGYSDPHRLRQMGEVLGASTGDGHDVQVILLTCTPERYAVIPHAHTVRLTA